MFLDLPCIRLCAFQRRQLLRIATVQYLYTLRGQGRALRRAIAVADDPR